MCSIFPPGGCCAIPAGCVPKASWCRALGWQTHPSCSIWAPAARCCTRTWWSAPKASHLLHGGTVRAVDLILLVLTLGWLPRSVQELQMPPTCQRGNLAGKLVKTQGIKVNSGFVRSGSLCSLLTIPQSGAFRRSVYFLWSRSSCKGLGAGMPCCRRAQAWLHVGSVAEPGDGNFLF